MPVLALLALLAAQAPGPAAEAAALKKSCDKGAGADCLRLAGLHARGEGVSRDAEKAASFLKKACELNLVAACFDLAAVTRSIKPEHRERARQMLDDQAVRS